MTLDASGNLTTTGAATFGGQVTAGPSAYGGTPNASSSLVLTNSSHNYITIGAGSTSEGGILFADAADNDVGAIGYAHSTNAMTFVTNAATRMTLDASGNLSVTGGVSASRFISFEVAYSSGTLTVLTMAAGATYLITARGANYGGTDNRHGSTFLATRANNGDFTHGTLIADSGVLGTFAVSGNDVTYSAGGGIPATTIAVTRIA